MSEKTFESPVFVRAAEGLIEEIACLEDALEFLYEWPKNRRGPIYQTALRACQKVFESNYPLGAARLAFISFAKSARILEDVNTPMPWMIGKTAQGGGVTA
jgi:hypothetical protein